MLSLKTVKNVFLVVFALWVNVTTSGGVIYGMSSLTRLMDKELDGFGQLWEKCKMPPDDCKGRNQIYSNIFCIACGMTSIGTAIFGFLMDYLGPKAPCLIGLIFFGAGNYLVGTTDSSTDGVDLAIAKFTIGFSFISMGGMGPYISSFNIANVTKVETTITSLIAALFNLTGLTYFLSTMVLEKANVPVDKQREFIGMILTYISIGQAVLAYLFWPVRVYAPDSDVERLVDLRLFKPRKSIEKSESLLAKDLLSSSVYNSGQKDVLVPGGFDALDISPIDERTDNYVPLKKETAIVQLLSQEFMLGSAFYSLSLLAMSFYLGTVFVELEGEEEWLSTNVLLQANLTPVLLAWPCALLLDRFGFSFGIGTVCVCSVVMFSTLLWHSITSFVISSVFLATFRCFLFATFFGFVAKTFGFAHYGAIVGVTALFAGVVGQLVLVLNWVAYTYDFMYVNIGLAIITGLFFPLSLTLGVWEWDSDSDAVKLGEPSLHPTLERQNSFGSRMTYKWSRFAMITPRRLRKKKRNIFDE